MIAGFCVEVLKEGTLLWDELGKPTFPGFGVDWVLRPILLPTTVIFLTGLGKFVVSVTGEVFCGGLPATSPAHNFVNALPG